ncbi:hypothetical protein EVAR_26893_1 [Eumeta japonica]|uniref:Uncharacterized protein n=1 Tax=Eumeta variegata TaxID=151549 RepID=A0A4C1VSV7_EUMVA|nr:hypothetical protein EVAR_26893_1 [Eumeta japonica]
MGNDCTESPTHVRVPRPRKRQVNVPPLSDRRTVRVIAECLQGQDKRDQSLSACSPAALQPLVIENYTKLSGVSSSLRSSGTSPTAMFMRSGYREIAAVGDVLRHVDLLRKLGIEEKYESKIKVLEIRSLRNMCGVSLKDRRRNSDDRAECFERRCSNKSRKSFRGNYSIRGTDVPEVRTKLHGTSGSTQTVKRGSDPEGGERGNYSAPVDTQLTAPT